MNLYITSSISVPDIDFLGLHKNIIYVNYILSTNMIPNNYIFIE